MRFCSPGRDFKRIRFSSCHSYSGAWRTMSLRGGGGDQNLEHQGRPSTVATQCDG
ncbi:hypothetical protein DPMN_003446 [Dreissena polymorpha]|uniref:Uncharacterized protein n=1 Tax=Dreissena polymorpha TaxID=45954 RepID=A0A9D4MLT8_DREPO|nr:hypothetical protein DPMN_003446 [Dreissena polymorpha]